MGSAGVGMPVRPARVGGDGEGYHPPNPFLPKELMELVTKVTNDGRLPAEWKRGTERP